MPALSDEWVTEINRRSDEYDAGKVQTIPWEQIRSEALGPIEDFAMKPVDFLPGARLDFDASFDWYAVRSVVAAERFSIAVEIALGRIADNPEQFARIDGRHRERIVRRFPFRIVFRVESSRIVIVAIAHAKRRPNYWKGRI